MCSGCSMRGFAGGITGSFPFRVGRSCSFGREFSPLMVSITLSAALAPFSATSSSRSLISSVVRCGCLDGSYFCSMSSRGLRLCSPFSAFLVCSNLVASSQGPSYFLVSLPLLRGPRAFNLCCLYSRALVLSSLVTSSQGPSYFLASSSLLRGPRAFELRCLFSRAFVFSSLIASSQGPSFLRALLPLLMSPRTF
ncbi:hypothetical protein Salat_1880500 [Sesamum alatum]|uniref:Uncharacterized protein n=1 Tax=Sesamum alatum TaxID=300844 RepID=A0AAE1Y3F0_9LAMI|nr:hypothetical protein Salat_1880500 [Sesamum alatum]